MSKTASNLSEVSWDVSQGAAQHGWDFGDLLHIKVQQSWEGFGDLLHSKMQQSWEGLGSAPQQDAAELREGDKAAGRRNMELKLGNHLQAHGWCCATSVDCCWTNSPVCFRHTTFPLCKSTLKHAPLNRHNPAALPGAHYPALERLWHKFCFLLEWTLGFIDWEGWSFFISGGFQAGVRHPWIMGPLNFIEERFEVWLVWIKLSSCRQKKCSGTAF